MSFAAGLLQGVADSKNRQNDRKQRERELSILEAMAKNRPMENPRREGVAPSVDGGAPVSGDFLNNPDAWRAGISAVESSGRYDAVGPETKSGRAYGRYQVMGYNIGPWSKAALGRELTPEEFIADPKAQDAVFDHQFGSYVRKYGNVDDAASAWFSGRPMAQAGNASDGYTTVPEYVAKFRNGLAGYAPASSGPAPTRPAARPISIAPAAQPEPPANRWASMRKAFGSIFSEE